MSHVIHIQTEIRDPVALRSACQRLQLPEPVWGTTRLYSSTATGWAVRLPEWRYPVVCDTATARIAFDHYGGRWGAPEQLDRLLQAYAVEKSRLESRRQGHSCCEQRLADGSIKLTVQIGGAA